MADLSGKVALVTGAGSGIGRGTAERLARDGADVCIADIDQEGAEHTASAVREFGREALVVKANVASQRQVEDAVEQCVQAAARQMVRLGNGGRIVCIASLAAELTGAGTWAYSVTKAGVRMAVRGWAQELGQHGITVNAIGPGVIDTPLA